MLDSTHPQTHENLTLGEGVLLRGVDTDALLAAENPAAFLSVAMEDTSRLIGATKEGCTFRCQPSMLDATRGHRTPAVGELLTGSWQVTLSGTLLEMAQDNAAMLLNAASDASGCILPAPSPVPHTSGDLCWVGAMGSGLLAIALRNPVSTAGLTLRASRNGFGEIPFALLAQKSSPSDAALPCCLLWLKEADA